MKDKKVQMHKELRHESKSKAYSWDKLKIMQQLSKDHNLFKVQSPRITMERVNLNIEG